MLNKVTLIGRLTKDPEIRTTQDGKEIASFGLATSEHWTDKRTGERKEKTEFHRITVFSPGLMPVVKNYIKKGSKIYLEGAIQGRKWTDKEGKDNFVTEIVLQAFSSQILMLDSKPGQTNYNQDEETSEIPY